MNRGMDTDSECSRRVTMIAEQVAQKTHVHDDGSKVCSRVETLETVCEFVVKQLLLRLLLPIIQSVCK